MSHLDDDSLIALEKKARESHGRYYCRLCIHRGKIEGAMERYCMGIYATLCCAACWKTHSLNHDRAFDPADAGESMDPIDGQNELADWGSP
jgi:hypothetical protein